MVKTLGSADSHLKNGRMLTVKGIHYRETNVLLGGAVLLVREPDNVSIYFCFFNSNVAIILLLLIFVDRANNCRLWTRTR